MQLGYSMMEIYVLQNGERVGPFSEQQVTSMLVSWDLSLEDSLWYQGLDGWQSLRVEDERLPILANEVRRLASQRKSKVDGGDSKASEKQVDSNSSTSPCPYCGELILRAAKKCKHCGEFLTGRREMQTNVAKILGLTALVIGIFMIGGCVLMMIGTVSVISDSTSGSDFESPVSEEALPEIVVNPDVWITYRDQYRSNRETMTDLQFDKWWQGVRQDVFLSYGGKRVVSNAYVDEVKRGRGDSVRVILDLDHPSNSSSHSDIQLYVPPAKRDLAMNLKKDQFLSFSGTLTAFDYSLGSMSIMFKNGSWEEVAELGQDEVSDGEVSTNYWMSLRDQYRENREKMTDLQFDKWWAETRSNVLADFKGQEVSTSGYVHEVKDSIFGGLQIHLDLDHPSVSLSMFDVTLVLSDDQREMALSLSVGQKLSFTGTLVDFNYTMGGLSMRFENIRFGE